MMSTAPSMQKAAAAYAYSSEEPKTEQLGSDQSVAAVATTHDKSVLHESLSHVFMVNLFSIVFFSSFLCSERKGPECLDVQTGVMKVLFGREHKSSKKKERSEAFFWQKQFKSPHSDDYVTVKFIKTWRILVHV